jgi:FlaA1/EpsC-like NDP-sugar epimerase
MTPVNDFDITEALLGRAAFNPPVPDHFRDKSVLITGAGGSIGSALVSGLSQTPCRIVAYDRSETNLTRLISSARVGGWKASLAPFLGDITQLNLLNHAFAAHRPHIVIHAAAYKHLPLLESFPAQAVDNNVIGTWNVLKAAVHHRASRFVLVSTDKACNPTSVMGATKRLAEMITLHPYPGLTVTSAGDQAPITRASVVRLGNVLGSSGSVLPLFESQIAAGGPITVTHPDATRFFMAISEAAGLILTALSLGRGGDTFALDMGQPVNIYAMALRLAGIRGRPTIRIKFTGMRAGEKLTEQLCLGDTRPTGHPRVWEIGSGPVYRKLSNDLLTLADAVQCCDEDRVMYWLRQLVPEYTQAHLTEANTADSDADITDANETDIHA